MSLHIGIFHKALATASNSGKERDIGISSQTCGVQEPFWRCTAWMPLAPCQPLRLARQCCSMFTTGSQQSAQVETIQTTLNRPSRNSTCSASKAEGEGGGRGGLGNDRASERERGGDGAEIEGKKRQTQEERAFASDSEAQRQRIRIRAEIRRAQPQLRPCTLRARCLLHHSMMATPRPAIQEVDQSAAQSETGQSS